MTPPEDGPQPLERVLGEYLEQSGLGERIEEATAALEWEERVGERIGAVTTPLRVSNGTLIVAVRSSAWMMELKMMEREILRRLNAGRDRGRIDAIRFVMADG